MRTIEIAIPDSGNSPLQKYLKGKYEQSLRRAGAKGRWIDLSDPDTAIKEALRCDGLLLSGGPDIEPALYGQMRSAKCGKPDPMRDLAEPMILKAFYKTGKPIFGVCRGMQLMNVCFGGTLKQDIRKEQCRRHFDFLRKNRGSHLVTLASDSKLPAILGGDTAYVNSLHHQAVDSVGKNLTAAAISEDGFVEALEITGYDFGIAVQWHPEHMVQNKAQQNLIAAFVKACKGSAPSSI